MRSLHAPDFLVGVLGHRRSWQYHLILPIYSSETASELSLSWRCIYFQPLSSYSQIPTPFSFAAAAAMRGKGRDLQKVACSYLHGRKSAFAESRMEGERERGREGRLAQPKIPPRDLRSSPFLLSVSFVSARFLFPFPHPSFNPCNDA